MPTAKFCVAGEGGSVVRTAVGLSQIVNRLYLLASESGGEPLKGCKQGMAG